MAAQPLFQGGIFDARYNSNRSAINFATPGGIRHAVLSAFITGALYLSIAVKVISLAMSVQHVRGSLLCSVVFHAALCLFYSSRVPLRLFSFFQRLSRLLQLVLSWSVVPSLTLL